jgi:hypothetical protein
VALTLAGVSRALPVADLAGTAAVGGGRLRVLMVISRPAGTDDVGYQMVARPLLERLGAVRGQVDLVVLRPPTLQALRTELAEAADAGRPFQVVHFDGHGILPGRPTGGPGEGERPVMLAGPAAEGVLAFEQPGGGSEAVSASQFAGVLRDAKVPVVVLNACQSGAVGKDLEASVATALLRAGARRWWRWPTACTRSQRRSSWPCSTSGCSQATASARRSPRDGGGCSNMMSGRA